jgi:serine/threonine protein kinase
MHRITDFFVYFVEYAQSVHASTCGDVYSFGIVLLEMITGKRPNDSMFEGDLNIANFVERFSISCATYH